MKNATKSIHFLNLFREAPNRALEEICMLSMQPQNLLMDLEATLLLDCIHKTKYRLKTINLEQTTVGIQKEIKKLMSLN